MNGTEHLGPATERPYLAELNLPLGCAIRNKCDKCDHYCRFFRYNYNLAMCPCICGASCEDCQKCLICNTPTNRTFAKYQRFRYLWRQPRSLLEHIRSKHINRIMIESEFNNIWPSDMLILSKICQYLT